MINYQNGRVNLQGGYNRYFKALEQARETFKRAVLAYHVDLGWVICNATDKFLKEKEFLWNCVVYDELPKDEYDFYMKVRKSIANKYLERYVGTESTDTCGGNTKRKDFQGRRVKKLPARKHDNIKVDEV